RALARIPLGLADPAAQHFDRAPDLLGDRSNRSPLGRMERGCGPWHDPASIPQNSVNAPCAWSLTTRRKSESLSDSVNESVSRRRAGVLCDIGPDLLEVLLGKGGQPIRHLQLLRARRSTARLNLFGELPTCGLVVHATLALNQLIKAGLHVG